MSSPPSYSSEPSPDERRLGIAVQSGEIPAGSFGTLVLRGSGIAIALKNQHEDARRAIYGRNASVAGEVSLSTTQGITSVQVNLEGKVTFVLGNALIPDLKLLHLSSTLWETGAEMGACPTVLPFGFVLPENFKEPDSGSTYPLPPSYDPLGDSVSLQDMHVRCVYRLTVMLVRSRWMPNKSMSVDMEYAPRTVPPRAIMDAPFPFFDTIKSAPEEWHQMSAVLPTKPHATAGQIPCDLFIPSVRVFTRRDMVPFFLQLRGTSNSMLALYSPGSKSEEGLARRLLRMAQTTSTAPQISVSIKRQVVLDTDGTGVARSYTIGTGSMRPVPPGYVPPGSESNIITMDYEGEIQFASHVTVGGFDVGRVRVSDFIILSIKPSVGAADQFSSVTHTQSIRVVTG
ncbi:hypothetical protein PENSPDRAFT_682609 [Peniophora sp. CONT]|nr:hypothetical protein PENSPDRAFT_682609 [Peniophora sp. CONT]